ncbi:MAG: hypothetical protein ABIZ34_03605, partial [Candidatus Limnocylindrales bacterium]
APRLFERHAELVGGARELISACACTDGCPACTGPRAEIGGAGKELAVRLLTMVEAEVERPSRAA